jgi:hypothetical protein
MAERLGNVTLRECLSTIALVALRKHSAARRPELHPAVRIRIRVPIRPKTACCGSRRTTLGCALTLLNNLGGQDG